MDRLYKRAFFAGDAFIIGLEAPRFDLRCQLGMGPDSVASSFFFRGETFSRSSISPRRAKTLSRPILVQSPDRRHLASSCRALSRARVKGAPLFARTPPNRHLSPPRFACLRDFGRFIALQDPLPNLLTLTFRTFVFDLLIY